MIGLLIAAIINKKEKTMDNHTVNEEQLNEDIESGKIRPVNMGELKAGFNLVSGLNKINNDLRGVTIQKPDAERALELLKIIEEHVKIVTKP